MEIKFMGSVKDFVVLRQPTASQMGEGNCVYTNRYSVLDWGKKRRMPDEIPYADASRCMLAAYVFEELANMGILTHYEGLVDEDGSVISVSAAKNPMNTMRVKFVNVYQPEVVDGKYDYSIFQEVTNNF